MPRWNTLGDFLKLLDHDAEAPALVAFGKQDVQRISRGELKRQVDRLAAAMREHGLRPGDHVGLFAPNSVRWIVACLAAIRAGAVAVPIDAQAGDDAAQHILDDSDVAWLFTHDRQRRRLAELDVQKRPRIVAMDDGETDNGGNGGKNDDAGGHGDDITAWHTLANADATDQPPDDADRQADDHVLLFYTSGTTGPPKGVPLTHANILFQLNVMADHGSEIVRDDDRILLPLPLHHVYPLVIGLLVPLSVGGCVVLPQSMTGPQMTRAMKEGEVTGLVGVPRLYQAMFDGIAARLDARARPVRWLMRTGWSVGAWTARRLHLRTGRWLLAPLHRQFAPNLRIAASGGSALDEDTASKIIGFGWQVLTGYGLTETAPLVTWNRPGDTKLGSVGRPLPGVDVRIDTDARPENDNGGDEDDDHDADAGEILIKGPNVFAGYRNLPDKTDKSFSDDGYYRTGDLGRLDDDGFLHILGRLSTMIVTAGGENVRPQDVEQAYAKHEAIGEIGVLNQEDRLVAVVVPAGGQGGDEDAIRQAIDERSGELPSYQRINDFQISSRPLPRTHLGKIRRHQLQEQYEALQSGRDEGGEASAPLPVEQWPQQDRALLDDAAAAQAWDWLCEQYADQRIGPDTHVQRELGIDSMQWLDVTLQISRHAGVDLEDEAIGRIETVRDLLQEVGQASQAGETASFEQVLDDPLAFLDDDQKRWLRRRGRVKTAGARLGHAVNRLAMKGYFRVKAEHADRLPEEGPLLIAPTHQSYLDSFALAAALPRPLLRRTFWAGGVHAAFRNALFRLVSDMAQAVPIDETRHIRASLAYGAAVLDRGGVLVWFPEGRRSRDGELQNFKQGLGVLADHFGTPIVPTHIRGAYEAWPGGQRLPRPKPVTIRFGEPQSPADLADRGEGDSPSQRIVDALRKETKKLIEAAAAEER